LKAVASPAHRGIQPVWACFQLTQIAGGA